MNTSKHPQDLPEPVNIFASLQAKVVVGVFGSILGFNTWSSTTIGGGIREELTLLREEVRVGNSELRREAEAREHQLEARLLVLEERWRHLDQDDE